MTKKADRTLPRLLLAWSMFLILATAVLAVRDYKRVERTRPGVYRSSRGRTIPVTRPQPFSYKLKQSWKLYSITIGGALFLLITRTALTGKPEHEADSQASEVSKEGR